MLVPLLPLGCSLMGLDDFGGAPCQLDTDCAHAEQQLRPGSAACGTAVCHAGLCQWQAGREICNGKDDDCDGLIDEASDVVAGDTATGQVSRFPTGSSASLSYAYAAGAAQAFVAVQLGDGTSKGVRLSGGEQRELNYDSLLGNNCPANPTSPATCNFSEVALAADTRHLVIASINTDGCAAGQVRVGLSDIDSAPFDVWLGKQDGELSDDVDNIGSGVDVGAGSACTGASGGGGVALGATRPAVASLGTEAGGEGALLLWLSAHANLTSAPADSIPVQALGLFVPSEEPVWLNGMDHGKPTRLGESTALSAPAVLALKSLAVGGKYLVAFPAAQDPATPASEPGILLLTVQPSETSAAGRAEAMLNSARFGFLPAQAADQVTLALGNHERAEIGVAWRSGSGADAQLCLTVVTTRGEVSSPKQICVPAPTLRFSPQLLYRPAGFAVDEPRGGWFLSWVETVGSDEQVFRVERRREMTLEPLGNSPLHAAGIPVLYPSKADEWSVSYAVVQPAKSEVRLDQSVPLWCQ